jgi:hypothetical protein
MHNPWSFRRKVLRRAMEITESLTGVWAITEAVAWSMAAMTEVSPRIAGGLKRI